MTFRILVTGSRSWAHEDLIHTILDEYSHHSEVILVSGHCLEGADAMCEKYAEGRRG